jgi:hypothetical protein
MITRAPVLLDVRAATVQELLAAYAAILDELRQREIVRSSNSPVCDYAELLFCVAFGWNRERNSSAGYDATDKKGIRYQIKARRLTRHNRSRQLSAIRRIDSAPFDQLAGVLFDEAFQVIRAGIMPLSVVHANSKYVSHSNSWRFLLRDEIWEIPGVRDVTSELRAATDSTLRGTMSMRAQRPR